MKRWPGSFVIWVLMAATLACCLGVVLLFNFQGERVVYETALNGHSILLVRQPPKDIFGHTSLMGVISDDSQIVSGPFWMGSLYGKVEFSEYLFPEDGVLLIYDREMPDSILIGIDTKNRPFIASTAFGFTRPDGREPALNASTVLPPWMRANASATHEASNSSDTMAGRALLFPLARVTGNAYTISQNYRTGQLAHFRPKRTFRPESSLKTRETGVEIWG